MRRSRTVWSLVVVLSGLFVVLFTLGQGSFQGEAAESPADQAAVEAPAGDSTSSAPCCLEPTPEQIQDIKAIKQQVGINLFEGTLLADGGVEACSASASLTAEGEPGTLAKVQALRDAAHELDAAAHLLETQGLYARADEVRRLAGELRLAAREIKLPAAALEASKAD